MLKKLLLLFVGVMPTLLFADVSHTPKVELVSEYQTVEPGESFWVGLQFHLEDGWHTYWKNPGDTGFAPEIEWDLPQGFTVEEVKWPFPKKFEHDALVFFGYEEDTMLLAKIAAPASLQEGEPVEIGADVSFLSCKESCVPIDVSQKITLLSSKSEQMGANPLFAKARERLPIPSESVAAMMQGDRLVLTLDPEVRGDYAKAYFFPEEEGVIQQEVSLTEGDFALNLDVKDASMVKGVIVLSDAADQSPMALQIDHLNTPANEAGFTMMQLLLALGGAFLGGAILNLMPCVLPVISLKIMSFVNMAGSDRKQIFKHGIVFTIGVLVSFWILASAILILRAGGAGVGWGFQLQSPVFVAIMIMVIFLLGLSLLGVFEFGTSLMSVGQGKQRKGLTGSFFSGILATLVATPCTGPLMAPALGFAMTLPATLSLLIFTMLGLGMASPYLLISAFPKLLNKLPKPGPWMIVFKQIMGLVMMGTMVWLLWVFQAQAATAVVAVLLSLFILAVGAWIFGRWGNPTVKRKKRYIAYAFAISLVAAGAWFGTSVARRAQTAEIAQEQVLHAGWVAWDPERFEELRAEGTPVFVDFTAKWCLQCQFNKVPIHAAEVQKRFEALGVVCMEADWTNHDDRITEELAKHERNGVPLYVLYGVDDDPVIFPQMLTKGMLLDKLK